MAEACYCLLLLSGEHDSPVHEQGKSPATEDNIQRGLFLSVFHAPSSLLSVVPSQSRHMYQVSLFGPARARLIHTPKKSCR